MLLARCQTCVSKHAMKTILHARFQAAALGIALLVLIGVSSLLAQKLTSDAPSKLPARVGEMVTIQIPGLPAGAKKLEFIMVPGLGGVQPFLLAKYEVTQGQYEAVMHT